MRCNIYEVIDHNPTVPPGHKELNKKHLEEIAIEPFANKVCAEIIVDSEIEESYPKALHEVESGGGGFVITDTDGQYGNSGSLGSKLIVQGSIDEGAPVAFYTKGVRAECFDVAGGGPWMLTYPFESGELTELNLRVTGEEPDEPPVTEFLANQTSGPVPLTIQFNDTSINAPTAWNWNFGDGNTSSLQNPVHTFTIDGTYNVSLTAANAAGTNTTTKQNYVYAMPITGGDKGNFLVHCNVDGAEVFFDGEFKGIILNGTLLVQVYVTAPHYTEYSVSKSGYLPVVDSLPTYPAKDQTVDIFVTLDPVPPGDVYYISASAMRGGLITPSGLLAVNAGDSLSFTITALSDYAVFNTVIDNQSRGPLANYTFTDVADSAMSKTATYENPTSPLVSAPTKLKSETYYDIHLGKGEEIADHTVNYEVTTTSSVYESTVFYYYDAGMVFIWIALVLAVVSGVKYTIGFWKRVSRWC